MKRLWTAAILMILLVTMLATLAAAQVGVAPKAENAVQGADPAQSASQPTELEPAASGEPHTEMLDNGTAAHDPLLEPKPLPRADLSLIGGIARKVDAVHNRVTVQPFGGGEKYLIYMDDRTHILSAGRETTVLAIHPGDRIYADTQTLGSQVFARTIEVRKTGAPAQASGQVIEVLGGRVRLQDRLSGTAIQFAISDRTKVEARGVASSAGELHTGSLIDVIFMPGGKRTEAQSITIHASPGGSYVFAGKLTHVDLRDGVLALDDQDGTNFELSFDPASERNVGRLVVGAPVSVTASFDGKRYRATSIKVNE